jgi:hypothetical protein
MSKGHGRVERAILAAISTPDAVATYTAPQQAPWRWQRIGPVGVPLELIYETIYDTTQPTRAQRHSVHRAIRNLRDQGKAGMYLRFDRSRSDRWVVGRPRSFWEQQEAELCTPPYLRPPRSQEKREEN